MATQITMVVAQKLTDDSEADGLELSVLCPKCEHADAHHCPGGKNHGDYRSGNGRASRATDNCPTRHCMEPLCSCVGAA